MINKIRKYFNEMDKTTKTDWIIFGLVFTSIFLIFVFSDILLTTRHGISFFDLFLKGDLYNFYKANYQTGTGFFTGATITYDVPIFIIFGIWNIPIWIFTKLSNIPWEIQLFNVIWAKMILVFFLSLSCMMMYKIFDLFKVDLKNKKIGALLFVSSPLVIMVIALFGGYDIISVFFTLTGIYYYMKNDNKKFILFFTVAVSLKLFALFIFIPLLLLKEKKILKIGLSTVITLLPTVISKIIYHNAPMYQESMNWFEGRMINRIMDSKIGNTYDGISIFVSLIVILYIYCYIKKIKNDKEQNYMAIYIPLVVYSIFITFIWIHPQWLILIIPYMIIFLILNKQNRKVNLLLETAFGGLYLLLMNIWYPYVFSPNIMKIMLLDKLFKLNNVSTNMQFFEKFKRYSPTINACLFAILIVFLYLNNPNKLIKEEKLKEKEKFNRFNIWARCLIIVPFALIIIYYCFKG